MLLANVAASFSEHERHEGFIIADGFAFSTHGLLQANDQVTDGGPSATLELPSCGVGPPFGGACGSARLLR